MNETLIENIDISSKLNKNSLSNEKEINKTKLNVNSSIKPFTDDNSNNQNYCPICGKLLLHEIKNIDNNSTEDELKNTFSFNDRICNRCRGPFQHKKEKLEKLSIPILVSLLLQASLKHLDVNNMVNQVLYGKQNSLKSAIVSNISAPLILSPHSSQLLIINDKGSIVLSSKKKDDFQNTITNMLHHKIDDSDQQLLNFGALQKQAIQLTPSGRKPRTGPLGSYEDMIVQALISIGDINGSKPKDIFDWMEQHCLGIPEAFRASASQALKKAVEKEKVQKIGNGLYKMNKKYELEILSKKGKQNLKLNATLPYLNNLSEISTTNSSSNDKNSLMKANKKSKKNIVNKKNKENINSENNSIRKDTSLPSNSGTSSTIKRDSSQVDTPLNYSYKKRKISKRSNMVSKNLNTSNETSQSIEKVIASSFSSPLNLISNTINSNKLSDHTSLMMNQVFNKNFSDVLSPDVYNNITSETNLGDQATSSTVPLFNNNSTLTSQNQDIYNSSYALSSKKKNDMNLLSKYTNSISNDMTNIKAIYEQLIQEDPSTIPPNVVSDSTDELNLLSSNLFNTTVEDEDLNQENTRTNNMSLFFDPRLQYLINPNSNALSTSVLDFLNQSNTINPITQTLTSFNNSSSTPPRTNPLNYSLYNNILWSNNRS